jgi:hypothetical protein
MAIPVSEAPLPVTKEMSECPTNKHTPNYFCKEQYDPSENLRVSLAKTEIKDKEVKLQDFAAAPSRQTAQPAEEYFSPQAAEPATTSSQNQDALECYSDSDSDSKVRTKTRTCPSDNRASGYPSKQLDHVF